MKKLLSRIVTGIVTMSLLASLACHANNTQEVTSFSDVPKTYWGYTTIMNMTEYGLFVGTSEPVNGIGTFSPEKTMTKAEFITASMRAVYSDKAEQISTVGSTWWSGFYKLAADNQIIKYAEMDAADMNRPATRAEMAMIMVRCLGAMGEYAEQYISTEQIADYADIPTYYKEYVLECFSMGLLCGIDNKGTFAPEKTLTRAEAATVLNRLVDESMRIDVEFLEESIDDDNKWDSNDDKNNQSENNNNSNKNDKDTSGKNNNDKVNEDKQPWDEFGAKQPKDYTWEEYEDLSEAEKNAFFESFKDVADFDAWLTDAQANAKMPWKKGGKHPSEYTWEEYEALDAFQQDAFFESFDSAADFDKWMRKATGAGLLPWEEDGVKQPDEYTWEEYEDLSETEKNAFFECFDDVIDFDAWLTDAQANAKLPWEKGGKQPDEYTWADYEALSAFDQDAFFESFDSAEDFERWMNKVTGNGYIPWEEDGAKQPDEYTWEEYEALSETAKKAFIESFRDMADFDEWVMDAQANAKLPWDNGGKQPSEYTWEEYEALNGFQQDAFFESFDSVEDYEDWFEKNQP